MKIATVIANRTPHIDRLFDLWITAVKQFFTGDDIIVVRDKADGIWGNEVEGKLIGINAGSYDAGLPESDSLKMQAFRLIGEPVMVIDCDCILQSKPSLPNVSYAIAEHTPQTASQTIPHETLPCHLGLPHYNCAVQYFGKDFYGEFYELLCKYLSWPRLNDDYMHGEYACSELFSMLCDKAVLPAKMAWYALKRPYPEDVIALHYGRAARSMLNIGDKE